MSTDNRYLLKVLAMLGDPGDGNLQREYLTNAPFHAAVDIFAAHLAQDHQRALDPIDLLQGLQPRERFPLPDGAKVTCPHCGEEATVEGDRVIWICRTCKAMGYYEQPQGRYFPAATYLVGGGEVFNR